jgi:putative glycosyltransferase
VKLSIIATLYKSAPYIQEFVERASKAAEKVVSDDYEIILVNDGSPDDSLEIAVNLTQENPHLTVVDLSRNFGHHKAMMTGLAHANGEQIFLIDSDLEEEPEWLIDFSQEMLSKSSDVVYGVQDTRKGGWFERLSGALFYTLFNYFAQIDHPRNIVTARLMSRHFVQALLLHKESEIVISCLWVITGFKQTARVVKKHSSSPSTYSLRKKISHVANSITSFSSTPLRIIFYIGLLIATLSLAYVVYLVALKFVRDTTIDGWTSVIASIWLLGGLVILFLGVIGIYLSKIFVETKQRPLSIVRKIYGAR